MGEPVSEPQFVEKHVTTVGVTHIGGGFSIHAVEELKDTVLWVGNDPYKQILCITTHYPDGSVNEDIRIQLCNCVSISIQHWVQKVIIKPERKAEQAAARAARNEPLGGIDRSIS